MFEVQRTGSYPRLCLGEWIIRKNGVDMSRLIPDEKRSCNMNTLGTYSKWHFDENHLKYWEYYESGLGCESWIAKNEWISTMCDNHEEMVDLFHAIQAEDWWYGSCNGCI